MSKYNQKANRINEYISAKRVFLIDENNEKIGIVFITEALEKAKKANLDLVEVARDANPPVCKIMDYGKYCFLLKKNQVRSNKEARAKAAKKELQIRPNIGEHDFQVKMKQLLEFLDDGCKVSIVLKFKGRQVVHPEIGLQLLRKFVEATKDKARIDVEPVMEGRRATMQLSPLINNNKTTSTEQKGNKNDQDQ